MTKHIAVHLDDDVAAWLGNDSARESSTVSERVNYHLRNAMKANHRPEHVFEACKSDGHAHCPATVLPNLRSQCGCLCHDDRVIDIRERQPRHEVEASKRKHPSNHKK